MVVSRHKINENEAVDSLCVKHFTEAKQYRNCFAVIVQKYNRHCAICDKPRLNKNCFDHLIRSK